MANEMRAAAPAPAAATEGQSVYRRAAIVALNLSIVVISAIALYLCAVILPSALDNTIVYRGF
jgi:hypothetical protein